MHSEGNSIVFELSASSSGGSAVTFEISGGADAGLFELRDGKILAFRMAPEYDQPLDANFDQRYGVEITGTADGASATLPVVVEVQFVPDGVKVTRVASGLGEVVGMVESQLVPGRVLIGTADGYLHRFNPDLSMRDRQEIFYIDETGKTARVPLAGIARWTKTLTDTASDMDLIWAAIPFQSPTLGATINFRGVEGRTTKPLLTGATSAPASLDLASSRSRLTMQTAGFQSGEPRVLVGFDDGDDFIKNTADDGLPDQAGGIGKIIYDLCYCTAGVVYYRSFDVADGLRSPLLGSGFDVMLLDRYSNGNHELMRHSPDDNDYGWPRYYGANESNDTAAANDDSSTPARLIFDGSHSYWGLGSVQAVHYYLGGGDKTLNRMDGEIIFGTATGRIVSLHYVYVQDGTGEEATPYLRDRTFRLTPDVGTIDGIVAFLTRDDGSLLMLDKDGELYLATQQD